MSVNGKGECSFPLGNHLKEEHLKEMIRQGPIGPLGAPQLAIQFYGIVVLR